MNTTLTGVSKTLLIPLTARVVDSLDEATAFQDPEAVRVAEALDVDLSLYARQWAQTEAVVGRTALFDRIAKGFTERHPEGQIVSLGSGLCTRLFRVDNGQINWVDVDLPAAMEVAQAVLPPHSRRVQVAGSVLDDDWYSNVASDRPTLFIIEGLLMYFRKSEVRALLLELSRRYPGSEVALEGIAPFLLRSPLGQGSATIRDAGAKFRWGLGSPKELLEMVPNSKIIDVGYHAQVFPHRWRWMRVFRSLRIINRAMKVVHLQLPD
jgi:O-methyltransferase involved in polyketide biosynthesis